MPPVPTIAHLSPRSRTKAPQRSPEQDRPGRSIWIGLGCTLLFHILLFTLAPMFPTEKLVGTHSNVRTIMSRRNKSFDFQLANPPPPPQPANPFKFVETNPDAPTNEPDKTNNFSNRNQQSAQAEAAKEKDAENRPSIKGQDQIKNDSAIVSGDHAQPQQGAAVTASSSQTPAEQQQNAQQARAEQVPDQGFDKTEGKSEDGVRTNISRNKSASTHADQLVEGSKDSKSQTGELTASTAHTNRPQPKPRPRLSAPRSTILENRITGTPNVGVLGCDARWSEYGEYMNELIGIIDAEWHSIVEASSISPKPGTHVIVTFRLNSDGEVRIQSIEKSEETAVLAAGQCTSAITVRQPYRKWTDQMISVLGKDQAITFGFYYY
ncbi:MAG: hypothetical protein ACHQ5A_00135 [Opitutales bacterium]